MPQNRDSRAMVTGEASSVVLDCVLSDDKPGSVHQERALGLLRAFAFADFGIPIEPGMRITVEADEFRDRVDYVVTVFKPLRSFS